MSSQPPEQHQATAVPVAFVCALLMIAQQVGAKALRDTLFLSAFPAERIPLAWLGTAVLAAPAVLLSSRLLERRGPGYVVPRAFALSAALFFVEYSLSGIAPLLVALVVFGHVGVFGSILISGFWSTMNERFDPHTAKRVIGRIVGGATLGGLAGGLLADRVAAHFDIRLMLILLGILCLLCAAGLWSIARHTRWTSSELSSRPASGLRESSYLRKLGVVVLATALVSTLVDYVLKVEAAAAFQDQAALMRFFAVFYTVTGVATFLLQSTLSTALLHRIGLGGTLAVLPCVVVAMGAATLVMLRLWTAALLKALESALANSLFRSGYELFYTPLPERQKRSAKTIIDVAFERAGDALGSGAILLIFALAPNVDQRIVVGLAMAVALLTLVLSLRLQRSYVAELARSLRSGLIQLRPEDAADVTTRLTLSQTIGSLDRSSLLEEIQSLRASEQAAAAAVDADAAPSTRREGAVLDGAVLDGAAPHGAVANRAGPGQPQRGAASTTQQLHLPSRDAELLRQVRGLLGTEPTERVAALQSELDPRLTPMAITLLDDDDMVAAVALQSLRRVGARSVGALVDALLDPNQPERVRRRLPRVLAGINSDRGVDGLLRALHDAAFGVRFRAAQALLEVRRRFPELAPDRAAIFEAVERELGAPDEVWDEQTIRHELDEAASEPAHASSRSLEHVFNLLGVALEPEAIGLGRKALLGGDTKLRGVALEYLENVVPDSIWNRLLHHLPERVVEPLKLPSEELLEELKRSLDDFDVSALREGLGFDSK